MEQRLIELETCLDGRIADSEARIDNILNESERRHDGRLKIIEKVTGGLDE